MASKRIPTVEGKTYEEWVTYFQESGDAPLAPMLAAFQMGEYGGDRFIVDPETGEERPDWDMSYDERDNRLSED